MSAVSDYINTNNLNCLTWIDGSDSNYIQTSGSTFTAINKLGNVNYDFIQPDVTKRPTITANGLSFISNQFLQPRNLNILSNLSLDSYSILFITNSNLTTNKKLFSISKNNPTLPPFIEYSYGNAVLNQEFSLLNVFNPLDLQTLNTSQQVIGISHDIRLGHSKVSINGSSFISVNNSDKGYILNNFPYNIYLGNNNSSIPFTGELIHFLLFSPAISNNDVLTLLNLVRGLSGYTPPASNQYNYSGSIGLNLNLLITNQVKVQYNYPIYINNYNSNLGLNLTTNISLVFFFHWDSLMTTDWNVITNDKWDNML